MSLSYRCHGQDMIKLIVLGFGCVKLTGRLVLTGLFYEEIYANKIVILGHNL